MHVMIDELGVDWKSVLHSKTGDTRRHKANFGI